MKNTKLMLGLLATLAFVSNVECKWEKQDQRDLTDANNAKIGTVTYYTNTASTKAEDITATVANYTGGDEILAITVNYPDRFEYYTLNNNITQGTGGIVLGTIVDGKDIIHGMDKAGNFYVNISTAEIKDQNDALALKKGDFSKFSSNQVKLNDAQSAGQAKAHIKALGDAAIDLGKFRDEAVKQNLVTLKVVPQQAPKSITSSVASTVGSWASSVGGWFKSWF